MTFTSTARSAPNMAAPRPTSPCLPRGAGTAWIHTLSLHDALPISHQRVTMRLPRQERKVLADVYSGDVGADRAEGPPKVRGGFRFGIERLVRSEEHTSELQSQVHFVCRRLLEKKE